MYERGRVPTNPTDPYAPLALTHTHTKMKTIEKSARAIAALAMPPKEGKTMYKLVEDKNMLLLSPDVFAMCKKKEIKTVIFTENGELEMADGSKMTSYKVVNFVDSELVELNESTDLEIAKVNAEFKVKHLRADFTKKLAELGEALVK